MLSLATKKTIECMHRVLICRKAMCRWSRWVQARDQGDTFCVMTTSAAARAAQCTATCGLMATLLGSLQTLISACWRTHSQLGGRFVVLVSFPATLPARPEVHYLSNSHSCRNIDYLKQLIGIAALTCLTTS